MIDIVGGDVNWSPWSTTALTTAGARDQLAINDIVYAELAAGFDDADALQSALDDLRLSLIWDSGRGVVSGGTCLSALPAVMSAIKPVQGLVMPHVYETVVEGFPQAHRMIVDSIIVNHELSDARFNKPQLLAANAPTRATAFPASTVPAATPVANR